MALRDFEGVVGCWLLGLLLADDDSVLARRCLTRATAWMH